MITAAILSLLGLVLHGVVSVLPSLPGPPSWLTSSNSAVATVFQYADSMSVWFPTSLVLTILTGIGAIWAAAFLLKISRMVVSLFTCGGGSAA